MSERGHAAVELAMGVAVMLLPVALVVTAFGPWSERTVLAEAAAAEAARAAVLSLDVGTGTTAANETIATSGLPIDGARLGWCSAAPAPLPGGAGWCPMTRGSTVGVVVEVWAPLIVTPWGPVGGLWVRGEHAEPIDLYRSFP